jgi:hypothetical protein
MQAQASQLFIPLSLGFLKPGIENRHCVDGFSVWRRVRSGPRLTSFLVGPCAEVPETLEDGRSCNYLMRLANLIRCKGRGLGIYGLIW